jgi:hypothetical protein
MAQKLDFEKLRHTGKPSLSIEDEAERRGADRAARWLEKADRPEPKHTTKRRKRRRARR